jgi:tetratricopeptide (TPR) repeat protein
MRLRLLLMAVLAMAWASLATPFVSAAEAVSLRETDETIPTYLSGPPDPNPMFYFGRQSQGAEGRIYPYPLYDNLTNSKGEQTYHLVYLENEFVKIAIAPELGGRLFSAVDKTNGYDFVYRQHVIKPALIGLVGAWISGGIEWNIPHHHRASTFLPVQWRTEEGADGSKTVWVGELELRHRMRWAVGYTLRPGSSVLTCQVRIVNRTPVAQTMLCFANVAVNANENYQIIFPPRTQWVTFHAKNQFSEWPVSHQRFSGADFTAGVDVSWYKNHISSNSMFAWNYEDDFFAGYDHGRQAGTMSVADHHVVPGKKFWTWGNGPRGRMWDQILTDDDGPYVELMVGAYSDNQPDYSWLAPFETRAFEMNWYPFRDIGGVKNANLEAAVNLDIRDGAATFGFNTTRDFPKATTRLVVDDKVVDENPIAIGPARPYAKKVTLPPGADPHLVRASLFADGRELIAYAPLPLAPTPQPAPYAPPPAPKDIANDEELFLAGQRADQFHSPTLDADPFWEEALRRDPGNVDANTGLGRLALRRAEFAKAESHFRTALARLTASYTTPKNVEPFYYLGLALNAQGRIDEAFDAFFKAAWSQEWKSPACFALGEIASLREDFAGALKFADQSIAANALNVRAIALKSAALRHLNRFAEAREAIALGRRADPLDVRLMAEQWLASGNAADADALFDNMYRFSATAQEVAAEFASAGLWADGGRVLAGFVATAPAKMKVSPMIYYYLGDIAEKLGDDVNAAAYRRVARVASPDYVFPFQTEAAAVLARAIEAAPDDARAPYYLGNLLFDWQPDVAIALWEQSTALDPDFPIAWRNLAQAWAHRPGDEARARALACLEKAVALPKADATHFAELDQLYEAAGAPVEKRLAMLEAHESLVVQKDEGRASLVVLKTLAGKTDAAIALLAGRTFSVWEGGTRFNTGEAWTNAHLARGQQRLRAQRPADALADFESALKFPPNLRAAERAGGIPRQAEVAYWIGCAQENLGHAEEARRSWTEAAGATALETGGGRAGRGGGNALAARATRYFQALALRRLGENDRADPLFRDLVSAGNAALATAADSAEAAATGAGQPRAGAATAHYLAGLGYAGLGDKTRAREELSAALAAAPDLLGAKLALDQL